ncbi:hypothetical protein JR316_0012406 [Psilocybe cubensis]|uniref:Uncharacterized protein n=2 Tax=Psilocybe cubensis TaxID=181762 RepID=A0ACB8GJS1_PSICU|nr:hypothetical protein JR316_0012406 [Psilocybe cubensis]KAH9475295.1 hypothetical protein JR316_0012406 [Psilocybe cubensis]
MSSEEVLKEDKTTVLPEENRKREVHITQNTVRQACRVIAGKPSTDRDRPETLQNVEARGTSLSVVRVRPMGTRYVPSDDMITEDLEDTVGEFSSMMTEFSLHADEDNKDNEPATVSTSSSGSADSESDSLGWINLGLSQLFYFTNDQWKSQYEQHATMSFEEELEMYDLLDLDAQGNDDPVVGDLEAESDIDEVDIDEDTHAILSL